MRTALLAALLAATACSKADPAGAPAAAPAAAPIPSVTVDELDHLLAAGKAQAVDANGIGTREHMGVIPGAVLLSDYASYAPSELPADKSRPLVFYCANTACGASHDAAGRARRAGYADVKVLPDGIAGWARAGKPTQRI